MRRWLAVTLLALAAAFWLCGTDSEQTSRPADPAAQRALDAVTTGHFDPAHPLTVFPANYQAVMGYLPQVMIGPRGTPILYKDGGDCSSFTGNTAYDFSKVCKEHDLSYDLVRYAERVGRPLPPTGRQQADDMFDRDLHARCNQLGVTGVHWAMCHTYADGFAIAVKLNSLRQGYRSPDPESPWRWSAMMLLFGEFLCLPAALRMLKVSGPQPFGADVLAEPVNTDQFKADKVSHSLQGMA